LSGVRGRLPPAGRDPSEHHLPALTLGHRPGSCTGLPECQQFVRNGMWGARDPCARLRGVLAAAAPAAARASDRRAPLPCLVRDGSHRNLYGSVTVPRMSRLCIAHDHESPCLHSRRLDICRISMVIMDLGYAKVTDRGCQLCKQGQTTARDRQRAGTDGKRERPAWTEGRTAGGDRRRTGTASVDGGTDREGRKGRGGGRGRGWTVKVRRGTWTAGWPGFAGARRRRAGRGRRSGRLRGRTRQAGRAGWPGFRRR
jgi:hypothetical protein